MPKILKITAVVVSFAIIVVALFAVNLIVSLEGDPYQSLLERLRPSFYLRTAIIIIFSSILYTPLSYGLSYFAWQSERRETKVRDVFFMLGRPYLFVKAILLRLIIWLTRGVGQVIVLALGMMLQAIIHLLYMLFLDINILDMTLVEMYEHLLVVFRNGRAVWLSALIWCAVGLTLVWMGLRYCFCKYALLRFNELGVLESKSIGVLASKGATFSVIAFWIKKISYYILMVLSFGLLHRQLRAFGTTSFASFAVRRVEQARGTYFHQKFLDK